MVNEDTGLIEDNIPIVLEYLFTNYGKLMSKEVKQMEIEVLLLSFNPVDHMVTIYRPIEQPQTKETVAGVSYLEEQKLKFGLSLIRNTRYFKKALGKWNALANNTWGFFESHLCDAQTELKQIRRLTM